MDFRELLGLEEAGWAALSSDGAAAVAFYGDVLADGALLVVPGMVIDSADFLASLADATPWTGHRIEDARVVKATPDSAALVYRVHAQREGEPQYHALVTSLYMHSDGRWKLAFHQQTPDPQVAAPPADSASAVPTFDGIDHIALAVSDLRVSEPWYRNAFGLVPEMSDVHDDGSGHVALLHPSTGLVFSLLSPGAGGDGRTGMDHVALECHGREELVRWRDSLASQGIEVGTITDADYGSGFVILDPDGTQLELFTV